MPELRWPRGDHLHALPLADVELAPGGYLLDALYQLGLFHVVGHIVGKWRLVEEGHLVAVHDVLASDLDLLLSHADVYHSELWSDDALQGLELLGVLLLVNEWSALLYLAGPGDQAGGKGHAGLLSALLAVGLWKLLVKVEWACFLHGSHTPILSQAVVSGVLASILPIRDWVISCR